MGHFRIRILRSQYRIQSLAKLSLSTPDSSRTLLPDSRSLLLPLLSSASHHLDNSHGLRWHSRSLPPGDQPPAAHCPDNSRTRLEGNSRPAVVRGPAGGCPGSSRRDSDCTRHCWYLRLRRHCHRHRHRPWVEKYINIIALL